MPDRSALIAVLGRPNAGKSTLVNQLVGEHVAIVSPIAQTTRRAIRAAANIGGTQLVFVDLPGSQQPVDKLTKRMQRSVVDTVDDVDAILLVIDGNEPIKGGVRAVVAIALSSKAPVIIALNKIDRFKPHQLLALIDELSLLFAGNEFSALVPVSAKTGDGCDALMKELLAVAVDAPPLFPAEMTTDMRDTERMSEYIREAALACMREEIPHALNVEIMEIIDEDPDLALHIDAVIWVERASQVGIVVGKGGQTLKTIGSDARERIEAMMGRTCMLHTRVKVKRDWRNDDAQLARWEL